MHVYDLNGYAIGSDTFRVTFNSDADGVDLHPLANAGGEFSAAPDWTRYERFGEQEEVSADEFGGLPTYDVTRDGRSLWTVWLLPWRKVVVEEVPTIVFFTWTAPAASPITGACWTSASDRTERHLGLASLDGAHAT